MKKRNKTYAIYSANDELLCIGNVHTCCEFLNISPNAFFKRLNRSSKEIYIVEEEISEKILPSWAYINLKCLGQCIVSIKKINRYGKEKIINELKDYGFKKIKISNCNEKEYVLIEAIK